MILITNSQLPITNSQLPITHYPIRDILEGLSKLTHPVFSGVS